jgi:hypothetical protein
VMGAPKTDEKAKLQGINGDLFGSLASCSRRSAAKAARCRGEAAIASANHQYFGRGSGAAYKRVVSKSVGNLIGLIERKRFQSGESRS